MVALVVKKTYFDVEDLKKLVEVHCISGALASFFDTEKMNVDTNLRVHKRLANGLTETARQHVVLSRKDDPLEYQQFDVDGPIEKHFDDGDTASVWHMHVKLD